MKRPNLPTIYWCFLTLLLSGCMASSTPEAQFYLLEPITATSTESNAVGKSLISLSPVHIPRYLDRPQIVTATGTNTYKLNELNRWAESLDQNINRVLTQNLTRLLAADVQPLRSTPPATAFKVSVDILEFHANPSGQTSLTVNWQIYQADQLLFNRQQSYLEPATSTEYRQIVAAMNSCLNRFSQDLASSLRNLAH